MSGMIILLAGSMVLTTIAYDDLAKWDQYALSMPLSKKELVKGKYLFFIISSLAGFMIAFFVCSIFFTVGIQNNLMELVILCGVILECCIFIYGIILPLTFQYGVEKARIFLVVLFGIPSILVFIGTMCYSTMDKNATMLIEVLKFVGIISPIFVIAYLYGSYRVSVRIFDKKSF